MLYKLPQTAAVNNANLFSLEVWRSEVCSGSPWAKTKVSARLRSFWGFWERTPSKLLEAPAFFGSWLLPPASEPGGEHLPLSANVTC